METALGKVVILGPDLEGLWSIAAVGETLLISERATSRILEQGTNEQTREVGGDQTSLDFTW